MGDSPAQSRGGRLSRWRTHCISTTARELLQAIVRRLDRGGSPDRNFPDRDGEHWALCPFHPDRHPNNFSVSQAGYHCFTCGASGGLWPLAEKLGVIPPRNASHTGGTTGAAERVHACTREGGDSTHTPTPAPENRTGNVTRVHA